MEEFPHDASTHGEGKVGDPPPPPPIWRRLWLILSSLFLVLAIIAAFAGGQILGFGTMTMLLGSFGFGMILIADVAEKVGDPPPPPPPDWVRWIFVVSVLALVLSAVFQRMDVTVGGLTSAVTFLISIDLALLTLAIRRGARF